LATPWAFEVFFIGGIWRWRGEISFRKTVANISSLVQSLVIGQRAFRFVSRISVTNCGAENLSGLALVNAIFGLRCRQHQHGKTVHLPAIWILANG